MARIRESNRVDGTLNGNSFRLVREGGYSHTVQRSNLPFNQSEEHDSKFNTRPDVRTMWQTSWSDGALWYKPDISQASIKSYFTATSMDVVSVPGDMIPRTAMSKAADADRNTIPHGLQVDGSNIYFFEQNKASQGLVNWASGANTVLTNDFGVSSQDPVAMCWDAGRSTIFALFANGMVAYVTPDSAGGTVIDVGDVYVGANIFMHFGRLLVYNGDVLYEIDDPLGTPAIANGGLPIYDDGMGPDALNEMSFASSDVAIGKWMIRCAVSSTEGVWITKNVNQEGRPTGTVTRVDRNTAGTNIGIPLATMPPGKAILDIQYHLGALLFTTTTDVIRVFGNDLSTYGHIKVDVHLFTLTQGLGSVGSPLGGPDPDDTVHKFLGAIGSTVYLGGHERIWVYDAVRGGLHPWDDLTGTGTGAFGNVFSTVDGGGTEILLYSKYGYAGNVLIGTSFTANDANDASLESNYFDFNIPGEKKEITHVTVRTNGSVGLQETWTIAISTDDAAFVDVATITSADAGTVKKRLSTTQYGYRFRYRITWSATGGSVTPPSRLKGLFFHALEGELVPTWNLQIDGKEFRNIEGDTMYPEDARTWLLTLMDTEQVVTYVDYFSAAGAPSYNVKVEACRIQADTPSEFVATVVLVEDI